MNITEKKPTFVHQQANDNSAVRVNKETENKTTTTIPGLKTRIIKRETTEPVIKTGQREHFVQMYIPRTAQDRALIRGVGLCFDQSICPKPRPLLFPPPRRQAPSKPARIRRSQHVPRLRVKQKDKYLGYNIKKKWDDTKFFKRKVRLMNKMESLMEQLANMPTHEGEPSLDSLLTSFKKCRPRRPKLAPLRCFIDFCSPERQSMESSISFVVDRDIPQTPLLSMSSSNSCESPAASVTPKPTTQLPPITAKEENECRGDNPENEIEEVETCLEKLHLLTKVDIVLEKLARITLHQGQPGPNDLCPKDTRRLRKPRLEPLPCSMNTVRSRKLKLDPLPSLLRKSVPKRQSLERSIGSKSTIPIKNNNQGDFVSSHPSKLLKRRGLSNLVKPPLGGLDKKAAAFALPSCSTERAEELEPRRAPGVPRVKLPVPPSIPTKSKKRAPQRGTTRLPPVDIRAEESRWKNGNRLSSWLHQLNSLDWESKIKAMKGIRTLLDKNKDLLQSRLHEVCLLLALEVKNHRTIVACAAMNTIAELHFRLQKIMDPEVAVTGRVLLLKFAQTTNAFLQERANLALDALVDGCSASRVLPVLLNNGLNHPSHAVRGSTALHLHQLANNIGGENLLRSGRMFVESFVHAVSKMSLDAAPEVRRYGQKILQEFSQHDHFLELLDKLVPLKDKIPLSNILKKMNQMTRANI